MCVIQILAAAEFWHKWICLDKTIEFTVEFEHDDEHHSNECIVDIRQGAETIALVMSPHLVVRDIQDNRVSRKSCILIN